MVNANKFLAIIALFLFAISFGSCGGDDDGGWTSSINLPKTGQTTSFATGDDGDLKRGVAWPDPRFTESGDCIADNLTGLMWTQNANLPNETKTWQQALDYANNLSLCSYTDWRLPNVNELESLVNAGQGRVSTWLNWQGFTNVQSHYYWSSTTNAERTDLTWNVGMHTSYLIWLEKSDDNYVWPVRAGQSDNSDPLYPANLWKTGQTTSYAMGDDGELKRGVAWPDPRFSVSGDCVTDNLTGLMWTQNANLPNETKTWEQALDYANNLSLCGYTDWRLPNRKELLSLIDYSEYNPALAIGHPFTNVQSDIYWSSNTHANNTGVAWEVYISSGIVYTSNKSNNHYVWPVRAGK